MGSWGGGQLSLWAAAVFHFIWVVVACVVLAWQLNGGLYWLLFLLLYLGAIALYEALVRFVLSGGVFVAWQAAQLGDSNAFTNLVRRKALSCFFLGTSISHCVLLPLIFHTGFVLRGYFVLNLLLGKSYFLFVGLVLIAVERERLSLVLGSGLWTTVSVLDALELPEIQRGRPVDGLAIAVLVTVSWFLFWIAISFFLSCRRPQWQKLLLLLELVFSDGVFLALRLAAVVLSGTGTSVFLFKNIVFLSWGGIQLWREEYIHATAAPEQLHLLRAVSVSPPDVEPSGAGGIRRDGMAMEEGPELHRLVARRTAVGGGRPSPLLELPAVFDVQYPADILSGTVPKGSYHKAIQSLNRVTAGHVPGDGARVSMACCWCLCCVPCIRSVYQEGQLCSQLCQTLQQINVQQGRKYGVLWKLEYDGSTTSVVIVKAVYRRM